MAMLYGTHLRGVFRRALGSLVQRPAPDFACKAVVNGEIVGLSRAALQASPSDVKTPGYFLLLFYPLDFTFVCPTELTAYADRLDDFYRLNCRVAGVSVDSEYAHLTWARMPRTEGGLHCSKTGFKMPLLADLSKEISRSYGVLAENGNVALRGQVLVDPRGIVRHVGVNDLGIGRSVEESLRLLQAVQFVDQHGEVCPANWKPGGRTIKPNPRDSKQYFGSQ